MLLTLGQFVKQSHREAWVREFPGENAVVTATFDSGGELTFTLSPPVSGTIEAHFGKRDAQACTYELAARIGERSNAVVLQSAVNIAACQSEGKSDRVLAAPGERFDFNALCLGFRSVFLGEDHASHT